MAATLPLAQAGELLDRLQPRVVLTDVDGTLVGQGGSLLARADGTPTLAAAEALVAAGAAGLEVVPVSGRTWPQLHELNRLLGLRDAVAELGTVLVVEGEPELLWGEVPRGEGPTPVAVMERAGALDLLLTSYPGRIEPHTPWVTLYPRQGTILLRGNVPLEEANARLADAGLGWARLHDNGRLRRPYPHLGPGPARAYHLAPAGLSKASTAAAYLARRGFKPSEAAAIGDGPADLELARVVGAMFLVAGDARAAGAGGDAGPVITTPSPAGEGWAEAVRALLPRVPRC